MFRVFRKLRISSIRKSYFAKYFVYGIGEISLVVIGILLALQLNSWNQQNQDRKDEKELLLSLKQDLESDIDDMLNTINSTSDEIFDLQSISRGLSDKTMSKAEFIGFNARFPAFFEANYSNASYNEAVSTGKLSIILNKELKQKLLKYYSNPKTLADIYTEEFMINNLYPKWLELGSHSKEYAEVFGIENNNFEPLDIKSIYTNKEFISLYNSKLGLLSQQIVEWEEQMKNTRAILMHINSEIASRWD